MRKLFFSAVATIMALSCNAQIISRPNAALNVNTIQATHNNNIYAKAQLASNQRQFGPYSGDECNNYIGTSQYTGENKVGVLLTSEEFAPYYGTKVVGVRFNIGQGCTATGAFVLDASADNFKELATAKESVTAPNGDDHTGSWQTIMFDEANQFELSSNYSELMIGYSYNQTASNYPIGIYSGKSASTLNLYINYTYGWSWYGLNNPYGTPCIQLILQNDNFPTNAVMPTDFGQFAVALGKTKNVDIDVFNLGTSLSNIDYTITTDGKTSDEQHLELSQSYATNATTTLSIPFEASTLGEHPVEFTITKVNGKANEATTTTAKGTNVTLKKVFPKVSVVEECTGTGCGYCPRGHAGMSKVKKLYGDDVVCLAAHMYNNSDPMYINTYYYSFGDFGSNAPSCIVNRNSKIIDPYFEMPEQLAKTYKEIPMAGISVSAAFNSDSTLVNATASVESLVSADYDVAYVLVGDSVGTKSGIWRQNNYYNSNSKSELPEDLQQFSGIGSAYATTFNDVILDYSYSSKTNKATFGDVVEGSTTTGSYTLSMPTKTTLKNAIKKDYLYVVAILTDKATGKIVNAAKTKIQSYATGINNNIVETNKATIVARYAADGTLISTPCKGINIIKMQDGTTRKVLVK